MELQSVVSNYWTKHNVSNHHKFSSTDESLKYLNWRNKQYLYYGELMPHSGFDGKSILDFGCGPGDDLVGYMQYSRPEKLIGIDVSTSSLEESKNRLELHGFNVELFNCDVYQEDIPVRNEGLDLIQSSGVLHHMPSLARPLGEFYRILKPGGDLRIMVYNRDSIWWHLYLAYQRRLLDGIDADLSMEEAFRRSTDGPDCPISIAYSRDEFVRLVEQHGFKLRDFSVSISVWEMTLLQKRFDALLRLELPEESRNFLYDLAFNADGVPLHNGTVAGINGIYKFDKV